jgi:hypothetical protein
MAYNNLQILNFNHNIVSLSNGNTLVITDNIKGNSISIPEPITHILQINSPGPQGPQGPTGSFATTGSNNFIGNQNISGNINITGSSITNINSGVFEVTSPILPSLLYITSSGYFRIGNPDGDYGIDMNIGGVGPMRLFNGNQITLVAPIIKFGLDGNPIVVEITGSLNVSGGITGSFSGDGANLTNLPPQVAGNTGEIQYKNNGVFGGVPVLTFNNTTVIATNINATGSFSGSFDDGIKTLILTGVSQSSTGDPTYNIVKNTLGDTFTFIRLNAGEYRLILDNFTYFTPGYTYISIMPGFPAWVSNDYYTYHEQQGDGRIKFWTIKNGVGGTDNVLANATIEIRVYPSP